MGLFYESFTVGGIFGFVFLTGLWVFINELTRKSKKASILAYCVLPFVLAVLVLTNVLGSPSGKTWFGWVKVISALIGVWGFMLIRFTDLGKTKFAAFFPVTILSINIAEAVFRELEVFQTYKVMEIDPAGIVVLGGPWNILNAIAGVLCIVTLTGFVNIKVSKDKSKDMVWPDMTWMYIIAYTLWNVAYVYNCISTRSMYSGVSILLAALIAEFFFKKGVWLQHRAQILAFYAMFALSFDFHPTQFFNMVPTYNPAMWMAISVISFAFNLWVFGLMIYKTIKDKKSPYTNDLYIQTDYYKATMMENNL